LHISIVSKKGKRALRTSPSERLEAIFVAALRLAAPFAL
jgi:hypothetical protein